MKTSSCKTNTPSCFFFFFLLTIFISALVLFQAPGAASATNCNPRQLMRACSSLKSPPSGGCCAEVKQQLPCACGYFRNGRLRSYVSVAQAKKILRECNLPVPNC